MRWCFLCSTEFPDDTRMVLADGGSQICMSCAETPRGKRLTESYRERDQRLLPGKPGSDRKIRLARVVASYLRKGAK